MCYTPVWEWISRAIRQFQESPAAAQFSSLTCRLRVNVQHYSVRFFNLWLYVLHTNSTPHVFVLTFLMKVTPSSKRIPSSGDAALQRRKQCPLSRVGRIPVVWWKHAGVQILIKPKAQTLDRHAQVTDNKGKTKQQILPAEKNSRFWGFWGCRLPSLCGCCSKPEDQQQFIVIYGKQQNYIWYFALSLLSEKKMLGHVKKKLNHGKNAVEVPGLHQRHRGGCVCWGPEAQLLEWESSCSSRVWSKHTCRLPEHVPGRWDDT